MNSETEESKSRNEDRNRQIAIHSTVHDQFSIWILVGFSPVHSGLNIVPVCENSTMWPVCTRRRIQVVSTSSIQQILIEYGYSGGHSLKTTGMRGHQTDFWYQTMCRANHANDIRRLVDSCQDIVEECLKAHSAIIQVRQYSMDPAAAFIA